MRRRGPAAALALLLAASLGRRGAQGQRPAKGRLPGRDGRSVVIAMGPTSEPEAGFDPAYGWGAGEHVHEPLIQSTPHSDERGSHHRV